MTGRTTIMVLFLFVIALVCMSCKDTPKPDVQTQQAPAPAKEVSSEPEESAADDLSSPLADAVADVTIAAADVVPDGGSEVSSFAPVDIVLSLGSDSVAAPVLADAVTEPAPEDVVLGSAVDGAAQLTDVQVAPADAATRTDAQSSTDAAALDGGTPPTDAANEPADTAVAAAPDVLPAAAGDVAAKPVIDAEVSRKVFEEFKKFVETGDFEQGAKLLEEWLKKSPMDLVNRQNLVHVLLKLEQYERALPHLVFMADEAENKGEWLGHLGRALVQVGEYARAAEALAEGLALRP